MNHMQFTPVSEAEAALINRRGTALGDSWWRQAEARGFAGSTGPNAVSFSDDMTSTMLLACLGIDSDMTSHLTMTVQHLAMAASRLRIAHLQSITTPLDDERFDDIIDAMSEAVCAAHVNYCAYILITIN